MKDKEKQIEEIAQCKNSYGITCGDCDGKKACGRYILAKELIDENSVVLTKEEYEVLLGTQKHLEKKYADMKDDNNFYKNENEILKQNLVMIKQDASKETAEKILNDIATYLKRYAHIHKHAENANKPKEEYADGTPVELNSVWEVLSLHKKGYDDHETMCELEDNIRYLAKSRLLQEFEKDFRIYAKQFGVEIKE